eukprot:4484282-Prymnesium_polylepis.1
MPCFVKAEAGADSRTSPAWDPNISLSSPSSGDAADADGARAPAPCRPSSTRTAGLARAERQGFRRGLWESSRVAAKPKAETCSHSVRRPKQHFEKASVTAVLCDPPWLGLPMSTVLTLDAYGDASLGASFALSKRKNLMRVSVIEAGEPAEAAGLKVGNVALLVDDAPIADCRSTFRACTAAKPRATVQSLNGKRIAIEKADDGRLGMTLQETAPVIVVGVASDSVALRCGLREGDELLSLNGNVCTSVERVQRLLAECFDLESGSRAEPLRLEVRLPRPRASMVTGWLMRIAAGQSALVGKISDDVSKPCGPQLEAEVCDWSLDSDDPRGLAPCDADGEVPMWETSYRI